LAGWAEASRVVFHMDERLLNLSHTLECGQAFRWRYLGGWWMGVVRGHVLRLRREAGAVVGEVYPPRIDAESFLAAYLRIDVDLDGLYRRFAAAEPLAAKAVSRFAGLRVLSQEPQETLLSYVCSTANSVARISRSVEELSRRFGRPIATLDGHTFYAFPSAESLVQAPEEELWSECGLGWRATNLKRVAEELLDRPGGWPEQLRGLPYPEAKALLMKLRGVGPKIADCVCLFSLRMDEAVPVDTHVWAIAREIFGARIRTRSLTPATYAQVASLFQERFGHFAGWAQEYLYMQRRTSLRKDDAGRMS